MMASSGSDGVLAHIVMVQYDSVDCVVIMTAGND